MSSEGGENSLHRSLTALGLGSSSSQFTFDDPSAILSAFRTDAQARSRPLATITLTRAISQSEDGGQVVQLLAPTIKQALVSLPQDASSYIAALRLLGTLYALSPAHAHTLFQPTSPGGFWGLVLPKIEALDNDLVDLLRADLLSTAATHTPSRAQLSEDSHVAQWLAAAVARGKEDDASKEAQRLALIAGLALYKLQRGSGSPDDDVPDTSASPSEAPDQIRSRREAQDQLLMTLARPHILSAEALTLDTEETRLALLSSLEVLSHLSSTLPIKEAITNDSILLQKLCNLPTATKQGLQRKPVFPSKQNSDATSGTSSYELDAHLASPMRHADSSLQYALSTIILNLVVYQPLLSFEEKQMKKLRGMANAKNTKGRETKEKEQEDPRESVPAVDQRVAKAIAAGATQALVAVTLAGVRTLDVPSSTSAAMRASPAIRDTIGQAFLHLTFRQDKIQRGKIAQAGGARALLLLSTLAIHHLCTDVSPKANPLHASASTSQGSPSLAAFQALARLCITSSPAILFGSPSNALAILPALATLYLHDNVGPVQRFEALLALTNLASLDPQTASKVARGRIPLATAPSPATVGQAFRAGNGASTTQATLTTTTVAEAMESSILLEENAMIRRSAIELLCNLAQDEVIFKAWTGEEEEEKREKKKADSETKKGSPGPPEDPLADGKARRRLHLLVALCSPSDTDTAQRSGQETSLAARLAASGALAMLSSSPTCCSHLLSLRPRTLNILIRCLMPGTKAKSAKALGQVKIREILDEEEEEDTLRPASISQDESSPQDEEQVDEDLESSLEARDALSSPSGPDHARASLSIRSVSILYSLVCFLQWKKDQTNGETSAGAEAGETITFRRYLDTLLASGAVEALRGVVARGVSPPTRPASGSGGPGGGSSGDQKETKDMSDEVRRMAVECLRILGDALGVGIDG